MLVTREDGTFVEFWGHNVHGQWRLLGMRLDLCLLLMAEGRQFEDFRREFLENAASTQVGRGEKAMVAGANG